jgi:hypothetical protein
MTTSFLPVEKTPLRNLLREPTNFRVVEAINSILGGGIELRLMGFVSRPPNGTTFAANGVELNVTCRHGQSSNRLVGVGHTYDEALGRLWKTFVDFARTGHAMMINEGGKNSRKLLPVAERNNEIRYVTPLRLMVMKARPVKFPSKEI